MFIMFRTVLCITGLFEFTHVSLRQNTNNNNIETNQSFTVLEYLHAGKIVFSHN